jgi:hypothetical protein
VYARILGAQGLGYPLWFPESFNEPISIGDIGFITFDGRFKSIFNIYLHRDDANGINYGAPPGFEPLIAEGEGGESPYECNRPGERILSERIRPKLTVEPAANRSYLSILAILFSSDLWLSDSISPVCPQKVRLSFCQMALSGKRFISAKGSSNLPNNAVSAGSNMSIRHYV